MNIQDALRYPLKDTDWVKKLGVGAVLLYFLFLIVPGFVIYGYGLAVTQLVLDEEDEELPSWTNWNAYAKVGFFAALNQFLYSVIINLPLLLIICLFAYLLFSPASSQSEPTSSGMFRILFFEQPASSTGENGILRLVSNSGGLLGEPLGSAVVSHAQVIMSEEQGLFQGGILSFLVPSQEFLTLVLVVLILLYILINLLIWPVTNILFIYNFVQEGLQFAFDLREFFTFMRTYIFDLITVAIVTSVVGLVVGGIQSFIFAIPCLGQVIAFFASPFLFFYIAVVNAHLNGQIARKAFDADDL